MNRREALVAIGAMCIAGQLPFSPPSKRVMIVSQSKWFGQSLQGVTGTLATRDDQIKHPLPLPLKGLDINLIKLDTALFDRNTGTKTDYLFMRTETIKSI